MTASFEVIFNRQQADRAAEYYARASRPGDECGMCCPAAAWLGSTSRLTVVALPVHEVARALEVRADRRAGRS